MYKLPMEFTWCMSHMKIQEKDTCYNEVVYPKEDEGHMCLIENEQT